MLEIPIEQTRSISCAVPLSDGTLPQKQSALKRKPHEPDNPPEKLRFHGPFVIQTTPDFSFGADVYHISKDRLIIVDGTGNGETGDRKGADELTQRLIINESLSGRTPAYVEAIVQGKTLRVLAGGGGEVVIWREQGDSKIIPEIIYLGNDADTQLHHTIDIDIEGVTNIFIASDGVFELLADLRLFGGLPGYDEYADLVVQDIKKEGLCQIIVLL